MKTFYEMTEALKSATDRAEAAEAKVREMEEEEKTRYRCVVGNIRRLNSKAWNKRTKNWVLARDFFSHGSNRAWDFCLRIGIDPEGHDAALDKLAEADQSVQAHEKVSDDHFRGVTKKVDHIVDASKKVAP